GWAIGGTQRRRAPQERIRTQNRRGAAQAKGRRARSPIPHGSSNEPGGGTYGARPDERGARPDGRGARRDQRGTRRDEMRRPGERRRARGHAGGHFGGSPDEIGRAHV